MELISIIMPVFNGERFLTEAIDSVLNQTNKNFELIIVDDGSTDISFEIIERYANIDKRVRGFHNENHGVSYSRNFALEKVKGEYIVFLDADDIIKEDMLEHLLQAMIQQNVDCVMTPICRFSDMNGTEIHNPTFSSKKVFFDTIFTDYILCNIYSGMHTKPDIPFVAILGRLFKTAKVEGIRFPIQKIGEDTQFSIEYMSKCDSAFLLNKEFYWYRQHSSSVTHKYIKSYCEDIAKQNANLNQIIEKIEMTEQQKRDVKERMLYRYAFKYIDACHNALRNPDAKGKDGAKKFVRTELNDIFNDGFAYFENVQLSITYKTFLTVMKIAAKSNIFCYLVLAVNKLRGKLKQ